MATRKPNKEKDKTKKKRTTSSRKKSSSIKKSDSTKQNDVTIPSEPIKTPRKSGTKITLPAFGLADEILENLKNDIKEPTPNETDSETVSIIKKISKETSSIEKIVTFYLDDQRYGLSITQVQEINRVGTITRIPNSPQFVLGVINLRGKILTVIDLKSRLLSGNSHISKESRVVVAELTPKLVGLLVDKVAQVITIDETQIEPTPEDVTQDQKKFIQNVAIIGEDIISILDLEQLLNREK